MDIPIRIFGMKIIKKKPTGRGDRLIALFDLETPYVVVRACRLFKNRRGYFDIMPPAARDMDGNRTVEWIGPISAIASRAVEIYRAMGGEYGDPSPSELKKGEM